MKFTVPGAPVSKGRPRVVRKGKRSIAFTPAETTRYENKVKLCALTAGVRPIDGPVQLSATFYLPTARRVDVDNLAKSVLDALNGVAFNDDSQVCELRVARLIDRTNPRAVVWVGAYDDAGSH